MSSMVLMKNKNGVVIATDSRLTKGKEYRDDFKKVFMIPEKDIMYGVVGFYGSNDENILKEIHQSLKTMTLEKAVHEITKMAKGFALYQQTNIYIVHKGQVTIIDLIRDNVFCGNVPENHVGVISIGSHSFMQNYYLPEDLTDLTLESLKEKAFELVQNECVIDRFIHQTNPNFVETIGGDIMVVSRTKEGLIEEDLFQNS